MKSVFCVAAAARSAAMEAVNHSKNSAMEADTISKHGRNSKSHTSRYNFFRIACFALLAACFLLLPSCSSPEKDGRKARQLDCDCEQLIRNNNTQLANQEQYRAQLERCRQKADDFRRKMQEKYGTNQEKFSALEFAYSNYNCK